MKNQNSNTTICLHLQQCKKITQIEIEMFLYKSADVFILKHHLEASLKTSIDVSLAAHDAFFLKLN